MEFIFSGEKIQLKCDYFIGELDDVCFNPRIKHEIEIYPYKWIDLHNPIINPVNLPCKIFCYTHILGHSFNKLKNILNNINFPFKLYFHNSDGNFIQTYYDQLKDIPNLIKIYSQNNTVPEVITLPIGQANAQWRHGNVQTLFDVINKNIPKTREIYFNFSMTTPIRPNCQQELSWLPWVENKPYHDYLQTLASYKYCICVEGNGLDTHRFWECMYLKVIPICNKNAWTECNRDHFPMIIVENWSELKNKILEYNVNWEDYTNVKNLSYYN